MLALDRQKTLYWYFALGYPCVAALFVWGFYVFTGSATDRKLNQIIAFCYIFTIVALVGSTMPWWIPGLLTIDQDGRPPAEVLRGCAVDTGSPGEIPPGVLCGKDDNPNYQWVLTIGGVVQEPPKAAPAVQPRPTQASSGSKKGQASSPRAQADPSPKKKPAPVAETPPPAPQAPSAASLYRIRGGIVVPLYVVVLSLMGGAVSMTRQVPEAQRRAMSGQDPYTNEKAREDLVFQIMQVVSAPLIAITAYYVLHPQAVMWAVLLGFASGFASEPILLMIRGLVRKLSPAEPAEPSIVAVRVVPSSVTVAPGKSQQFTAHVSGSPNAEVTWLIEPADAGSISQNGLYTAPSQAKSVTVTARSAADPKKTGKASVTVEPPGNDTATDEEANRPCSRADHDALVPSSSPSQKKPRVPAP